MINNAFRDKVIEFVSALKASYAEFKNGTEKAKKICRLIRDPGYEKDLRMLKDRVLGLLKAFVPKKGHAEIRFGADDPYVTGQVMQAAVVLSPIYKDSVTVIPDFGNNVLDIKADIKGGVRLINPVITVVRVFIFSKLPELYNRINGILKADSPETSAKGEKDG